MSNILVNALFVATVLNPAGNGTTRTEISHIVPAEDCQALFKTYMRRFDETTILKETADSVTFEEEVTGINNEIKMTCQKIEE